VANEYRLLSYRDGKRASPGVLVGERVYPAAALLKGAEGIDSGSVLGILQSWPAAHAKLAAAAGSVRPTEGKSLPEVALLAPILYPGALFCAGANYWDHMEEMAKAQGQTVDRAKRPKDPWFFLKTVAHSVIGPGAPAKLPAASKQIDWEAELGVVIGKAGRDLPVARAMEVVAGYTIVNDLSARDLMRREDRIGTPFTFDWIGQKCFDDAAPMGPWITPAAYIPDHANLSVKLWVNGVIKQDSNTKQLVHSIPEQISYLSHRVTLRPGDVIATGTPSGVGMPRGEFLKHGDTVKIEIGGCGTLTTPIA
jgi:2-keto-4-pentenoate hydratase/2-oxohepta-3-ene-1,7-dioic acid hydratase in catechol pathway